MEHPEEVEEVEAPEPQFSVTEEQWNAQQEMIANQQALLEQFQGPLSQLDQALNQPEPAPQFDPESFDPYDPNSVAQLVNVHTQPLVEQNAQLAQAVNQLTTQIGNQNLDQQLTTQLASAGFANEQGAVDAQTVEQARVFARGLYAEDPNADPAVVMARAVSTMGQLRGGGEAAVTEERTAQVRAIHQAPRIPAANTPTTEAVPEPKTELEAARQWAERARGGGR